MDPLRNPFSPGAGSPPPALAGRQQILDRARITFGRLKNGRSEKSFLLVGLRGVGKTVLLNEISHIAESNGYKSILLEAHENRSLASLLIPSLRELLFSLDRMEKISEKVKRGLRVLKSFLNIAFKAKYHDFEISMDIDPEVGTADSGSLESDLPSLLVAVAEAASDRKTVIALIIDELQYLNTIELSALIMAIHKINQKQLPLVLIGAGLPQLTGLTGRSKSYAERLFDFPNIGPLQDEDAISALQDPVKTEGVQFTEEAIQEILSQTKGYPYFLQEWGYQAWNIEKEKSITLESIKKASIASIQRLDESFFRVRFDRLTPREKEYLQAIAELDMNTHRSGDIAESLGVTSQSIAPIRNSLIKKGMIYSPSHGYTEFTVPLFDTFIRRAMRSVL